MTKQQSFIRSLRELSPAMTAQQIEQAILTLQDSRQALFALEADKKHRAYMQRNMPKGDTRLETYLKDVPVKEDYFYFQRLGKTGCIRTKGVSLLLREDYLKYRDWLPPAERDWWLVDRVLVRKDGSCRNDPKGTVLGGARPVLLIESIEGDLRPGDYFTIEENAFMLLNHRLAIRSAPLPVNCGYPYYLFTATPLYQNVDWWYRHLQWANLSR